MQKISNKRSLLIVEDNREVRDLFSEIFRSEGYHLVAAENGAHAYQLIEDHKEVVDVILTDLRMPLMDGLEFAIKIKADPKLASIPVVLLSATPLSDSKALKVFAALLIKPCAINVVVETINSVH